MISRSQDGELSFCLPLQTDGKYRLIIIIDRSALPENIKFHKKLHPSRRYEFYFPVLKTPFYSIAVLVRKTLLHHPKIKFIIFEPQSIYIALHFCGLPITKITIIEC